jgi:hypothetical protein
MKILEIINRGQVCCDGLPVRDVSAKSQEDYCNTLARMLREPVLDPLRPGIARDTYNHRRAALHTASRILLMDLMARCVRAARRNDVADTRRAAAALTRALDKIEPALVLDPPLRPGASAWEMPRSRWLDMDTPGPRRGKHSKKNVLASLPDDWQARLWQAVPEQWRYRAALAVHLLTPSRPEELVPGARPHGWSPGAEIELRAPNLLEITIAPVKTHGAKYGTPTTTIKIDPIAEGGPAIYFAELCAAAGGRVVVSITSKNAVRKAIAKLGQRALPELDIVITPYVLRHQALADIKATVGAGSEVAAAAGHCTDRTQSRYGRAEHGRKRKGFLGAVSSRQPRTSNVARAHALAAARRERTLTGPKLDDGELALPTI